MNPYIAGVPVSGGDFCSGTELFCADFETDGMITWDSTPGDEDCDGYDADGDWCDNDSTTYKNGSHALGVCGENTNYLAKAFSSDDDEFYIEYWQRTTSPVASQGAHGIQIFNDDYCVLRLLRLMGGELRIYHMDNAAYAATTGALAEDTWYHIGIHFKKAAGTGIVRVWQNTDGGEFDVSDLIYSRTDATGAYDGAQIRFPGPVNTDATYVNYFDDVKVISGAPSWSYE